MRSNTPHLKNCQNRPIDLLAQPSVTSNCREVEKGISEVSSYFVVRKGVTTTSELSTVRFDELLNLTFCN